MNKTFERYTALAFALVALILIELQFTFIANYTFMDVLNYLMPILIFAAISVGNVLGMWGPLRLSLSRLLTLVFFALIAGFAGLAAFRNYGLFWIAVPFVAYGMFLSRLYTEVSIKAILCALGGGGVFVYVLLNPATQLMAAHLSNLAMALALAAAVLWDYNPRRLILAVAGGGLIFAVNYFSLTMPPSYVEATYDAFHNAMMEEPPVVSPLVRTDLFYLPSTNQYAMVMNGSRWAVIPGKRRVESRLHGIADEFLPSYDMPYVFSKPKNVLVIGPAEGQNILAALNAGAERVVAVDINPAVFQILRGPMRKRTLGFIDDPRVTTVVSEGRHFLESSSDKFDLITLQGVQTASQSAALNTAVLESFLFTRESLATLWNHVSDDGFLFFDEYRSIGREENEASLLQSVAHAAREVLGAEGFDDHHLFYTYQQRKSNPGSTESKREPREGLLISKRPLPPPEKIAALLKDKESVVPVPFGSAGLYVAHITDNRPFFVQNLTYTVGFSGLKATIVYSAFLLLVVLVWGFAWPSQRTSLALFLLGAGYIQMIMGLFGPITLLLGNPNYASPVLFTALYGFGMFGGLWSLGMHAKQLRLSVFVAILALAVSLPLLVLLKPLLLSSSSLAINVAAVSVIVGLIAFTTEIPYILMLKEREGVARGWAYTLENLGTFAGVPLGLFLQFQLGFAGAMAGSIFCFLLAAVQLRK